VKFGFVLGSRHRAGEKSRREKKKLFEQHVGQGT
jgi:hypothetical protein